jgi:deoxycytidylate deaminase
MPEKRIGWAEYFLRMAETASERADCRRRKIGAVVVMDNRIWGTGYNGTYPGLPGCLDGHCPRGLKSYAEAPAYSDYIDCIAVHAEINAVKQFSEIARMRLFQGVPEYESLPDGWAEAFPSPVTLYVSAPPCQDCKYAVRRAGITIVI